MTIPARAAKRRVAAIRIQSETAGRIHQWAVPKPLSRILTKIRLSGHILCALSSQHKECLDGAGNKGNTGCVLFRMWQPLCELGGDCVSAMVAVVWLQRVEHGVVYVVARWKDCGSSPYFPIRLSNGPTYSKAFGCSSNSRLRWYSTGKHSVNHSGRRAAVHPTGTVPATATHTGARRTSPAPPNPPLSVAFLVPAVAWIRQ